MRDVLSTDHLHTLIFPDASIELAFDVEMQIWYILFLHASSDNFLLKPCLRFITLSNFFFYQDLVATTGVPDLPFAGGSHRQGGHLLEISWNFILSPGIFFSKNLLEI